jgi:hypothetical protein
MISPWKAAQFVNAAQNLFLTHFTMRAAVAFFPTRNHVLLAAQNKPILPFGRFPAVGTES